MTDKHGHIHRVQRAPTATLPTWVIVLMAAGVAPVATVARYLA